MTTLDPRALEAAFDILWPQQDWNGSDEGFCRAVAEKVVRTLTTLSQPQAGEPVAWLTEGYGYKRVFLDKEAADKLARGGDGTVKPLYASPQPALAVKGLALGKLPAEFRVRAHGQWLHFEDEQMAQESAEMHGTDYQGLYVRDGTPLVVSPPPSGVVEALRVTDAMVEAAEATAYGRHERGFINRPLIGAIAMRKALEAAFALSLAPATADGWRVVPVKPSEAMVQAARSSLPGQFDDVCDADLEDIYLCMIDAVPPAPGGRG